MATAPARALAAAIEPFCGQVYFSPECHRRYEDLGFAASPGTFGDPPVALPDGPSYFCSRGSVMGTVPGQVVAAAFGVFNPAVVVPLVEAGWALTDGPTICAARTEGATAQLRRVLGDQPEGLGRANELLAAATEGLRPEGKPLFAGISSLEPPDDPLALAWWRTDMLREFRGDAHVAAWTTAGFDATEIGLLTELYWGLPMRTYARSRSWSESDFDAAEERLVARGLVADGAFTEAGRAAREAVEEATDRACAPIVDALGDDIEELVGTMRAWSRQVQAAGGYPSSGPLDLSEATRAS